MGQGQSSVRLGSSEDGIPLSVSKSELTPDYHVPNLLSDQVRDFLDTEDIMGISDSILASPIADKEQELVPAVFTWTHGGQNVFVTGSFNHWTGKIPMHRSNKDFTVILEIPPGIVEYKFIVDDEWRFSPDQPMVTDSQGVVNNRIELVSTIEVNAAFDCFDDQDGKLVFGQAEPTPDDYTKDPLPLPPHLGNILLNSEEMAGQNDAVMLPVPLHVTLNHVYVSKSDVPEVCVLGMTQRFGSKFVTTVYYRPSPGRDPDTSSFPFAAR